MVTPLFYENHLMSEKGIIVTNLSKHFHSHCVLKEVNLKITPGELTAIIGRSGCGKSTLLRCLNGLETYDTGSIQYAEAQNKFDFGMVFQSFNLFPHFTVLENLVRAPIVVKGTSREEATVQALKLLDKVGLATHASHYPSQLSGGQQQRAAIARALAMSPKVLLYDEPTSALDPWLVDEVFQVMRNLDAEGMTQIVVTHEIRFVKEVAKKIVFIENGQIVEVGTPEQVFTTPKDPRTKNYLSRFC
jgi:ABC-type polar amino acid transport system ATPase subunit